MAALHSLDILQNRYHSTFATRQDRLSFDKPHVNKQSIKSKNNNVETYLVCHPALCISLHSYYFCAGVTAGRTGNGARESDDNGDAERTPSSFSKTEKTDRKCRRRSDHNV